MARSQLVDDGLWELVKPLLPEIACRSGQGASESVTGQRSRRSCSWW
jgi:transposase